LSARVRSNSRSLLTRWRLARAGASLPEILELNAALWDVIWPDDWRVLDAVWTRGAVEVFVLGLDAEHPVAVVKLASGPAGRVGLRWGVDHARELRQLETLDGWAALVPEPLATGQLDRRFYVVERALPGQAGNGALAAAEDPWPSLLAGARAIRRLHQQTGHFVDPTDDYVRRAVHEPLAKLAPVLESPESRRAATRVNRLLTRTLADQGTLWLSWIHGDYWLGNILFSTETGAVTGIVDWDRAAPAELPLHDCVHLLLHARKVAGQRPLGAVVADFVRHPAWSPDEALVAGEMRAGLPVDVLPDQAAVLLAWLRHVGENVRRDPAYLRDRRWVRDNVQAVLEAATEADL
jgi:hypothetical protein